MSMGLLAVITSAHRRQISFGIAIDSQKSKHPIKAVKGFNNLSRRSSLLSIETLLAFNLFFFPFFLPFNKKSVEGHRPLIEFRHHYYILCHYWLLFDADWFGSLREDKFVFYNLEYLQLFIAALSDDCQRIGKLLNLARHTLVLADVEVDYLHPAITVGILLGILLLQERKDQLANSGAADRQGLRRRMSICRRRKV